MSAPMGDAPGLDPDPSRVPTQEPNGTLWCGFELQSRRGTKVWFRIAEDAVGRMPPSARGQRLVDVLIGWIGCKRGAVVACLLPAGFLGGYRRTAENGRPVRRAGLVSPAGGGTGSVVDSPARNLWREPGNWAYYWGMDAPGEKLLIRLGDTLENLSAGW